MKPLQSKNGGVSLASIIEEQLQISPNEVELSSVPPEIAITGSLEIFKDPEI